MLIIGPTFAYSKRFTREHLCIRIKKQKKVRPRVNSKENFQVSYTYIRPPVHARLTQVLCSKQTTTILTTSNWKTNSSDLCGCKRLHWSNATRQNFSIWERNSSYYRCNLEWRKQNGFFFFIWWNAIEWRFLDWFVQGWDCGHCLKAFYFLQMHWPY